jgi:hexosaminidase
MVDLGRKFMSLTWLRAEIRELAYLKLNLLHLHLSDVNGFRLQSDSHPEIVSAQHYTKQEIRDLIAYAASYHVQIVPEIDLPGHADPILAAHPELRLVDQFGNAQNSLIDLSNPASYALMKDLIDEFAPLFPGRYWHLGADEYLTDYSPYPQLLAYARDHYGPAATAKDAFYGFINWADALVRATGKTARVWNDGLDGDGAVSVNPDVVVDHWSAEGVFGIPWIGPALTGPQLVAAGHLVQNDAFTPTYYTTGVGGQLLTAPTAAMYDAWNPSVFVDGSRVTDPAHNLGSMISLWFNDPSVSEADATAAIHDRLRVMAQQTWGSSKPDLLYLLFALRISAVGDAPA